MWHIFGVNLETQGQEAKTRRGATRDLIIEDLIGMNVCLTCSKSLMCVISV